MQGGYLALQDNKLHGTLPSSYSQLTVSFTSFLSHLLVACTWLPCGKIWLVKAQNLSHVQCNDALMPDDANCQKHLKGVQCTCYDSHLLQALYMAFDNNNLTGTIPPSWSNWSEVQRLECSSMRSACTHMLFTDHETVNFALTGHFMVTLSTA